MNPEDRLSHLPNCILYRILSFLPTKHAVRTSSLSTTWKNLFLELTNIHIDCEFSLNTRDFILCHSLRNFIHKRLILCEEAPISEFRIKCTTLPEPEVMSLWLTTLLSGRLKVLDVQAGPGLFYGLPMQFPPAGIFQSLTLEVLRLHVPTIDFRIPDLVWAPNLRVLSLKGIDMESESHIFRFADETYPRLEELSLVGSHIGHDYVLEISLNSLRKLTIISQKHVRFLRIDIDTPYLQHLKCVLDSEDWYSEDRSSNAKMQLNICKCEFIESVDLNHLWKFSSDEWCIQVLRNIGNVRELHITGKYGYCWNLDHTSFPNQFHNLTHLEIAGIEVKSVWLLLQLASNLESLVYDMDSYTKVFALPDDVPKCFAHSLQEIIIRNFVFGEIFSLTFWGPWSTKLDEMITEHVYLEFGRFLLQHGAVLEKMIIEHGFNRVKSPMLILERIWIDYRQNVRSFSKKEKNFIIRLLRRLRIEIETSKDRKI